MYYKRIHKKHNPNWPENLYHPYRILIAEGFGSGKTNALLNVINYEPDIDKIYLYAKDSFEAKYQLFINKRESTGLKYSNDSKAFIEYSNNMDDIFKNIETLKNIIQIKNEKYWFYLMIWLLICLLIRNLIQL